MSSVNKRGEKILKDQRPWVQIDRERSEEQQKEKMKEETLEKVKVAQSCPTLCDLMDRSPPGSSVHRILQARVLEWVAIPISMGSSDLGIKPGSQALQADSSLSKPPGKS